MRITNLKFIILFFLLLSLMLSSCGPSAEELTETSAAQTAAAASDTPVPTQTQTPTVTPSPAPTLTPAPTPIPGPYAKAMMPWEELNLPQGYTSLDPIELGIAWGSTILSLQKEDGTQVDYTIEGSFVFGKEWPEAAYGWTVKFPSDFDQEVLNFYIDNFSEQVAGIIEGSQGMLVSMFENPDDSHIGDRSSEAWGIYIADGEFWTLWGAVFKIDDIGGFVFLRHLFEEDQFIEISELATIYARVISQPENNCRITVSFPVIDSEIPAFEYKVEGFYPGENIAVALTGDGIVDGENERVTFVDYETDQADSTGGFHGQMVFGDGSTEIMSPEFELSIMGFHSQCTVIQNVNWPGTLIIQEDS